MTLAATTSPAGDHQVDRVSRRDRALALARAGTPETAALTLRTTTALGDDDLIALAGEGGLARQLAIARRERLSQKLCDALAQFGAPAGVAAMLENRYAKITPATLSALVERSREVIAYRVPLLQRPDLDAAQAARLYLWVSPALRDHIARNFPIDTAKLDRDREALSGVDACPPQGPHPARLIGHLRQGEALQFEAAFARLMRLRITSMRRIIEDRAGGHLAVACRAAGFTLEQFQVAFRLLQSSAPRPHAVPVAPHGSPSLATIYQRTDEKHAIETVKRWRRDSTANFLGIVPRNDMVPLSVHANS